MIELVLMLTSHLILSDYTPITSFEQRHKYKTEYENDKIEYLKIVPIFEEAIRRFGILGRDISRISQELSNASARV